MHFTRLASFKSGSELVMARELSGVPVQLTRIFSALNLVSFLGIAITFLPLFSTAASNVPVILPSSGTAATTISQNLDSCSTIKLLFPLLVINFALASPFNGVSLTRTPSSAQSLLKIASFCSCSSPKSALAAFKNSS